MSEFKFPNKVPPAVELTMKQMLARITALENDVLLLKAKRKPGRPRKAA